MAYSPARVFASLGDVNMEESGLELKSGGKAACPRCRGAVRQVEVTGSAELSVVPDRAVVAVSVAHSKERVTDCSSSVTRRLDYILQTLRQHAVKEDEITVMKHVQREGDLYRVQAEVSVTFSDFQKMQNVRSVLIEKLDKTVHVGDPSYSHSSECLSLLRSDPLQKHLNVFSLHQDINSRRRVCAAAVETARLKASEVCNMLGQALGRPLLVREEESREWRSDQREGVATQLTQRQNVGQMSITASSHVFVRFELRPKDNTRKRL
ncbi:interleukin-1 receptor-associated kinase 1-binding protein 1 homolog isoform X1 [Trichomycterus rosablanca]|uniref:interleukin-1 receptor-associated kinase 1-binding protein 1 homolog isoform X1 n=1 Tax=Trichomycterus rosablanca TaxID=2290929 RepID=UPI002F35C1D6